MTLTYKKTQYYQVDVNKGSLAAKLAELGADRVLEVLESSIAEDDIELVFEDDFRLIDADRELIRDMGERI